MTRYLVSPINTVKASIDAVISGDISIAIPDFGNNCAGRLIPGINKLFSNIATLVGEIRASSHTAKTLSEQLAARSAGLFRARAFARALFCIEHRVLRRQRRADPACLTDV